MHLFKHATATRGNVNADSTWLYSILPVKSLDRVTHYYYFPRFRI